MESKNELCVVPIVEATHSFYGSSEQTVCGRFVQSFPTYRGASRLCSAPHFMIS